MPSPLVPLMLPPLMVTPLPAPDPATFSEIPLTPPARGHWWLSH